MKIMRGWRKFWKPESDLSRVIRAMWTRYKAHNVGTESAALAFYLIFAIFPFLIFISALLNFFQLSIVGAIRMASDLLPAELVEIAEMFLQYGAGKPTLRLLITSLFFSFYYPMRATNSLMLSVRMAYRLGAPNGVVIQTIKNLIYTLLLILSIILTVLLMTVSDRILAYAEENLLLPSFVADWWATLRFPIIAAIGYMDLTALYALAQDHWQKWKNLWPGTLAALGGWMTVAWLYTLYVNNIARYSFIYGSIGTMIVLLIWLNFTSIAMILGAELNGALMSIRKERFNQDLYQDLNLDINQDNI